MPLNTTGISINKTAFSILAPFEQRPFCPHFRRRSLRPGARIPAINTIQEAADEPSDNLHVKVERTMTYQDPDSLDERDV